MLKAKKEVMKDLGKVLRRKIVIQKLEITEDEIGNQKRQWVDWKTAWAERNNLWGKEYYAAKAVNEEGTVVFTVRHAPFLGSVDSVEYQIKFEGKTFDIKQIDYLEDDGLWVKIKTLERGASG